MKIEFVADTRAFSSVGPFTPGDLFTHNGGYVYLVVDNGVVKFSSRGPEYYSMPENVYRSKGAQRLGRVSKVVYFP